MPVIKRIKDCSMQELKYLVKRCEWKQIYPDYYYVCKWIIKANKTHICYKWFGKNKTTKIFDDVLKMFNENIINLEVEVIIDAKH